MEEIRRKICSRAIHFTRKKSGGRQLYEGYSGSNFLLFYASNVAAKESQRMQSSVTWLIALWTIT
jgi:hypothetical protein